MFEDSISVDTKKKAYELIHDPTRLLCLLFSKYGNIREDYYLLLINQLVYDSSSHLNIQFKEYQITNNYDEYLKRFYSKNESTTRIPKLNDYYKNYYKFFCRPFFNDFDLADVMHNYGDEKAENFYKNNFETSGSETDEQNISDKCSSSLSSLDNITDNKTIFTKKNKKMIDNNLDSKSITITLTLSNTLNSNKNNLISERSPNNSFEKMVHNLVSYQKKKINKNINNKANKLPTKQKNKDHKDHKDHKETKENKENHKNKHKKNSLKKNITNYYGKVKNFSSNNHCKKKNRIHFSPTGTTETKNFNGSGANFHNVLNNKGIQKINIIQKIFSSPKVNKNLFNRKISKLEEYNNNCLINTNKPISQNQRNKTFNCTQNQSLNIMISSSNNNNLDGSKNKNSKNIKSNNLNYFHTVNNHFININNRKKNKTFDNNNFVPSQNIHPPQRNLYYSNAKFPHFNQSLGKKTVGVNGSKFNLVKNPSNNNTRNPNKTKPQNSYYYYQNILNQIMTSNNDANSCNKHKKNKTYVNNISGSSPKINSVSPINANKFNNNYESTNSNINKNKNKIINAKSKNKLSKNQINNFNINFNNVFFTSSKTTSYISDNNPNNLNCINNNNNNSSNNNTSNNNSHSNYLDIENKTNKNLYVMNLKNIYNFSRNKTNILNPSNNPLTQTDSHKPKNNFPIKQKSKKNNTELTGQFPIDFVNNSKKNIQNNEKGGLKTTSQIIEFIRKSQKNFVVRNHHKNINNIEMIFNSKVGKTKDDSRRINDNKSFQNFGSSKSIYASSSISRRHKNNISNGGTGATQAVSKNKNSNLTSKKNIKSKYKRKIK